MSAKALSVLLSVSSLFSLYGQSFDLKLVNSLLEKEAYKRTIEVCDSLLNLTDYQDKFYFLLSKKGDAYYYLGDPKHALESYLDALDELQTRDLEDFKQLQETQSYTGFTYNELGLHDKAITHFKESLRLAEALNDSIEVATSHYNISNSLLKQGNLDNAMMHLSKAYEIDKARKDTSAIGFDLIALGYAQLQFGKTQEAIKYYRESILLLAKSSGNFNSLGTRYNNLSLAFSQAKQYDSALHYNNLSIEVHQQFKDSINLAERWVNKAKILSSMSSTNEAISWAEKAKTFLQKFERGNSILAANEVLIECLDHREMYHQALLLSKENISLSKSLHQVTLLRKTLLQQSHIYEKLKDTDNAYRVYKEAMVLSDSLQSIESRRLMTELEIKYEVDKIESENKLLKLEKEVARSESKNRSQQMLWLVALVVVITIASISITLITHSRSKIKSKLLETEINELRLQIKELIDYKPEQSLISLDRLNEVLKDPLSEREFKILQLAMSEHNNSQIAEKIFLSVNTVKYHLKNIYQKLGVSNRQDALRFAFQTSSN